MPRTRRAPVSTDKRFRKIPGGGDHGTPERWQHSGRVLELTDRAGVLAARATEEHILDILVMRRLIDDTQAAAGFKFKADFHAAALGAHVTGSYSGMANARDTFRGDYERTDAQQAAYDKWRKAVRALGPRHGAAVIATLCHDAPPALRDIPSLQAGLDILARWYRLRSC